MAQSSVQLPQHAHRLIQLGLLWFLTALVVGLLIPKFGIPRVGLSAHLLGLMQGIFLVIIGLLWPRLHFGRSMGSVAFWLLVYGSVAAWSASLTAGIFRAGGHMIPLAAGSAQGTTLQEWIITIGLRSAAVSIIAAVLILLWATRGIAGLESDHVT